jgi:DNA-binding response OmpR family regulator
VKILSVGVNPGFFAVLKPVLSSSGCDVIVAPDGPAAFDKFRTDRVDLILMELDLPVMSGFEVTAKIRAIEATRELPWTPIIVLTVPGSLESPVTIIQAGADVFVSKAEHKDVLKPKILAMVSRSRARRQLETANNTLNNILNSVSEGGLVFDMNGMIIAGNTASNLMFGWEDADSLVGRPGHETIHHHHADS